MKKLLLFGLFIYGCINLSAQPGGYALRLQSNNNFGTAYTLTNNSPASGILSTTVSAASSAAQYIVEWDNYFNKWTNTNTSKDQETTLTWGGGNSNGPNGVLNGGFTNGKYYTLNIRGLSYSNRQAAFMETDNTPVSIFSVSRTAPSGTVYFNQNVTVTLSLSGNKSTQEKAFLRYSTSSSFATSAVAEVSFASGTASSGTAIIPAAFNTAGATVYYYVYTTTVAATGASDHDLITLKISGAAQTYTVSGSYATAAAGNWSDAATWAAGSVPPANASVVIDHNVTLNQDATVSALTINSGKTFIATDASPRTLTVSKSAAGSATTLVNNGTWQNGSGISTVVFTGTPSSGDAVHAISGTIGFQFVMINKIAGTSNLGASFGAGSSVSATLEIGSGGFVSTAPPASFYGAAAILKFNQGSGAVYDVNAGDYSWSTTEVPNNITISSGTINLNANRTASGDLVIDGGALVLNSNTPSLTIQRNWTRSSGTFTANTGTVTFSGSNSSTLTTSSVAALYNLVINKTGSASINLSNDVNVAHTLTLTSGNLNIGSNTLSLNGTVSRTSGYLAGSNTSNLTIGGTAGSLYFDQTSNKNYLKNFTLNTGATATLGNALNITGGTIENTEGILLVSETGSVLTTGGFLTLKSNSFGTARIAEGRSTGGYISGDVTVERFISDKRAWRLLSVPISSDQTIYQSWMESKTNSNGYGTHITTYTSDLNVNGFDGAGASSSIRIFGSTGFSATPATNTAISNNEGYFIFIRGNRQINLASSTAHSAANLRLTGTLKQGTLGSISVPATEFKLVGNPYVSPVDFTRVHSASSNLASYFYVWDPKLSGNNQVGKYVLFSAATGWLPDNGGGSYAEGEANSLIQTGLAFLVRTSDGSNAGSLVFGENSKASEQKNVYRTNDGSYERLKIGLSNVNGDNSTNSLDGVFASYNNTGLKAVTNEDAPKLASAYENLAIVRDGKQLSLEIRPLIDDIDTVYLRLWNTAHKIYQFKFTPANFKEPAFAAYLEDAYLKTSTPVSLTGVSTVNFAITSDPLSADQYRFSVVYRANSVLPISFTHVKAYQKGGDIQVEWNLGNESNISKYEVEKSADGRSFTKAGTQTARAIANANQSYNWLDASPNNGNNFYRIKAIEQSGQYKYSQVVNVKLGTGNGTISVYPNPVSGKVMNLQLVNQPAGKYAIQLFNNLGQQVYRTGFNHAGGSSAQTIQLSTKVVKGIYQLQIVSDNNQSTQKVVIE